MASPFLSWERKGCMQENKWLKTICRQYSNILGKLLIGIYLHGSVAFGCACGASDLDFIVVVSGTLSQEQKRELISLLLRLSREPDAPAKGFEMSVVEQTVCRQFCYPTPYLLHYSQSYQRQFTEDLDGWCRRMNGVDYDLAAHFTVIRQAGICLCGKPIAELFGPVPWENYLDSIHRDIQDAPAQIGEQPLYLTLNLCRVLAACRQGLVLSKSEGARWAMQQGSLAEFQPMLKQAQLCYERGKKFVWERQALKQFAKAALNQIDSALLKTQQDEKRRNEQMEQNKAEKWCKIEIYNEYLKKIPSLLVQIHTVEKMYEKAKIEQQMLTAQPENESRRQYQARLESTERQCACRLQEMQEELRLVQGLKAQLEEQLGEQLGCK